MALIDVAVFGSPTLRYRTGCCGSRSLEELTASFARRVASRYGAGVAVRYVDVEQARSREDAVIAQAVRAGRVRLPVVAIDGRVRYSGLFTPTFVLRDLDRLLSRAR
ncbi:MAG TPA: hypothetical protein VF234_02990 [Limnochordia bacterium]